MNILKKTKKKKKEKKVPTHSGKLDLTNKREVVNKLMNSISKVSGYSEYELKKDQNIRLIYWRKLALYILVHEFKWTERAAGMAFGRSEPTVIGVVEEFNKIRSTPGKAHLVLSPFNQVVHDLTL